MTTGWDIPRWIKHFSRTRILFSHFRRQSQATYFPAAEVLYHCAAQVHQRSAALAWHRDNAFHLGPNEMHSTVHFRPRGQAATAPFNLFECHVWSFLPMKAPWARPHTYCTQVQFLQSLSQEILHDSNSPLPPIFRSSPRRLCVLLCPHVFTLSIKAIDRHQTTFLANIYAPSFPEAYHFITYVLDLNRHLRTARYLSSCSHPSHKNWESSCGMAIHYMKYQYDQIMDIQVRIPERSCKPIIENLIPKQWRIDVLCTILPLLCFFLTATFSLPHYFFVVLTLIY